MDDVTVVVIKILKLILKKYLSAFLPLIVR